MQTSLTSRESKNQLHEELRHRILALPGVTERQNAGIHEDAFFVGRTMFMHIHGAAHCDIRLSKADQERILAEGKARRHHWAPEAGYVTFIARDEKELEPVMELIRISHQHFVSRSAKVSQCASIQRAPIQTLAV
jgi:hypothetical protein